MWRGRHSRKGVGLSGSLIGYRRRFHSSTRAGARSLRSDRLWRTADASAFYRQGNVNAQSSRDRRRVRRERLEISSLRALFGESGLFIKILKKLKFNRFIYFLMKISNLIKLTKRNDKKFKTITAR